MLPRRRRQRRREYTCISKDSQQCHENQERSIWRMASRQSHQYRTRPRSNACAEISTGSLVLASQVLKWSGPLEEFIANQNRDAVSNPEILLMIYCGLQCSSIPPQGLYLVFSVCSPLIIPLNFVVSLPKARAPLLSYSWQAAL